MTFSNLRNGNLLFILNKSSVPKLELGKVLNIPAPKYVGIPDLVIDITAEVDGNVTNFLKLPANGEIADFGNNIVVSCTKDAMNNEIVSMKQRSLDIVNSILLHKDIIKGCDDILILLNPEIKEKLRLEEENKALREEVNSLKEMFKEFMKSWQQ